MAYYQLRPKVPKRIWLLATLLLGICLGGPVIAARLVPVVDTQPTPIYLGSETEGWAIPLQRPDGSIIRCMQTVGDLMASQWDCDGTTIETTLLSGSRDQDNTFDRYLRLNRIEPAEVFRTGPVRGAHNAFNAGAISLADNQDGTEYSLLVYIKGEQYATYYNRIAEQFRELVHDTPEVASA